MCGIVLIAVDRHPDRRGRGHARPARRHRRPSARSSRTCPRCSASCRPSRSSWRCSSSAAPSGSWSRPAAASSGCCAWSAPRRDRCGSWCSASRPWSPPPRSSSAASSRASALAVVLWLVRAIGLTDLHLEAPAPWIAWAVAAGCGTGVALLGSWRSSKRASRTPPVAALREASLERRRPERRAVAGGPVLPGRRGRGGRAGRAYRAAVRARLLRAAPGGGGHRADVRRHARLPRASPALLARPFARRDVAARIARDEVRAAVRTSTAVAAPVVAISAIAGSMVLALSFTADWTSALDRVQLHAPLVVQTDDPAAVAADPTVALVDARRPVAIRLERRDRGGRGGRPRRRVGDAGTARRRRAASTTSTVRRSRSPRAG